MCTVGREEHVPVLHPWVGGVCTRVTPVGMRGTPCVYPWVREVHPVYTPWVKRDQPVLYPWVKRDQPVLYPWVWEVHPGMYPVGMGGTPWYVHPWGMGDTPWYMTRAPWWVYTSWYICLPYHPGYTTIPPCYLLYLYRCTPSRAVLDSRALGSTP